MPHSAAMLHCANPDCHAVNPQHHLVCGTCGLPLIKRYLWSLSSACMVSREGDLLAQRYFIQSPQVLLDTQPGISPISPNEIPTHIIPYLRLFPSRLNIPQVYGYLPRAIAKTETDLWLLEYSSVPLNAQGGLIFETLFPNLTQQWEQASVLRQLHWLWQIVQLWTPLRNQGVVSSLLNPSLLKCNGPVLQLQELQQDPASDPPRLRSLGQLWFTWLGQTSPELEPLLRQLCQALITEQIISPEELQSWLDNALLQCGQAQQRTIEIFANTDKGPTRHGNEDACFPQAGVALTTHLSLEKQVVPEKEEDPPQFAPPQFAIVCDGLGGHEGGEIASQMAIETLCHHLWQITTNSAIEAATWSPLAMMKKLKQAVSDANDRISAHNDRQKSEDRKRMGTTLVMTLAHGHEMYLTHVGDSRIYWITKTGCHSVTVDDDLAAREVHLGYALYRDILKYPSAGALVQALGMSDSSLLYPTTNRIILDEDCVFLLCSDGLSDYDRVEQFWQQEIQPLLCQETTVVEAGQRLIEIANQYNGHDNVTVALVHCQVSPLASASLGDAFAPLLTLLSDLDERHEMPLSEDVDTDLTDIDFSDADISDAEFTGGDVMVGNVTQPLTGELSPNDPPSSTQTLTFWRILLMLGMIALGGFGFLWWQRSAPDRPQKTLPPVSESAPTVVSTHPLP